jgi:hypothetical protein
LGIFVSKTSCKIRTKGKRDLKRALACSFEQIVRRRRFGQKGRSFRRWWLRGLRPTGAVDRRNMFAYVFAAVEPTTGRDFCLVLPAVSTVAMSEFLQRFSATLPDDEHALMVLDGAGWHTSNELLVPDNVAAPAALCAGTEPGRTDLAAWYASRTQVGHRVRSEKCDVQTLPNEATRSRCDPKANRGPACQPKRWLNTATPCQSSPVPAAANRSAASSMNSLTKGETCRLLGYTA